MARASDRRGAPWIAFLAGVIVALALVAAWWALSGGWRMAESVADADLAVPRPVLPDRPIVPPAPPLPDAPVPTPR